MMKALRSTPNSKFSFYFSSDHIISCDISALLNMLFIMCSLNVVNVWEDESQR